jgi:hypothetical protein
MGFSAIPTAGLGFFFSSFLTMIFWGMVSQEYSSIGTIGYPQAMAVTIGLWLVVAPLAAASGRKGKK